MTGAPQASVIAPRKGRPFRLLPKWNPRKPLPLTIKLRGGPECWVEVHSRGALLRVPGNTSVYDVLRTICNDH